MYSVYLLRDKFDVPFATHLTLTKSARSEPQNPNHDWNLAFRRELIGTGLQRTPANKLVEELEEVINLRGHPKYTDVLPLGSVNSNKPKRGRGRPCKDAA